MPGISGRFLELRELKQELRGQMTEGGMQDWIPRYAPLVRRLRQRISSLQTEIWCYSESGEYARHDPNVDVRALVRSMRERKLLPAGDSGEEEEVVGEAIDLEEALAQVDGSVGNGVRDKGWMHDEALVTELYRD